MTLYQVTQSTDNGNGDTVGTLSYAIRQANVNAGTDAIELKTNVRITSVMKTLLNSDIVVIGNGKSVSGDANNNGQTDDGDLRPFFIKSGKADFYDLTITNSTAKGGDGNDGGGGAGMGGGMFIYEGNVFLSNVTFNNNRAQGGNVNTGGFGGGGGIFGNANKGGGGLFASSTGRDGGYGGNGNYRIDEDDNFGGGGDSGAYSNGSGGFGSGGAGSSLNNGGNGGFGGGGGYGNVGDGGYGGGGGGGGLGGKGGNYGGDGTSGSGDIAGSGGGGAGLGGAIFIRSGNLTLNSVNLNNNAAKGGSGANKGNGLGGALFIMQSTTTDPEDGSGLPTSLPTVVFEGTSPIFSGNSADETSTNDLFGSANTVTAPNPGNNLINGTSSNDILIGAQGNDTLNGNAGTDIVYGGVGNDAINGGAGNDSLIGGAGADRFIFNSGVQFRRAQAELVGVDTITDFVRGTDKIVLSKTTFTGINSAVGNGFSQSGEFRVVANEGALRNLLQSLGSVNIVYNQETGGLNYISDNPLELRFNRFATIQGQPGLTMSDFQIVA
jgi:hypothetical protein